MAQEISDRTRIQLTLVWSLVAAAVTLTATAFKMRIDTLQAVEQSVKDNIHALRLERQEALKHYVAREEWLVEVSKMNLRIAELEAKRDQQYWALRELISK